MDHLEIISDTDSEIDDPTYIPSSEDDSSCSEYDDYFCYQCEVDLEYEENEFYDWETDRVYCRNCWCDMH